MVEKTVIYYYSGSGNSLSVAKHIGEALGNTTLLSIYTLRDDPEVPADYTRIGIVTATWFVRPPRVVKEVCEKLRCSRQQKIFILATCGGYDGYVCIDLKAILQPKTDFAVQTFMLPMPPNHIVGFSPMPDWINRIYLNHEAKASVKIAEKIQSDAPTKNRKGINRKALTWASATFNQRLLSVDRDSVEGGFYTSDACTKCGICEKLCKNDNIHMTEDGPVWGHDCQQCMACIMWCPNRAIRHPNVPEKRRRYQNPNVTLNDMMQSEFHVDEPCVKERRRNSMCKICKMDEEELRKFKKEHSTFIAVGTTLIIVGVAAGLWKMMKKCCRGKKTVVAAERMKRRTD
ncbi:MAG: EFR1 family ferrodoxin [Lachnospiraceae bacterium]|nr:EFR1 family ferrodoxin [Lachnospiraceae bacterium]